MGPDTFSQAMDAADKKLWTPAQLAERWGMSKNKVLDLFHAGAITAAINRFDLETVEKQLKARSRTPTPENPEAKHTYPPELSIPGSIAEQIAWHAGEIQRLSQLLGASGNPSPVARI